MMGAEVALGKPTRGGRRKRDLVQSAFALHSRNLGRKIAIGASFQFFGIVLRSTLTIGSTAILARLLMPADFGYVAMATVVTEFAALFGAFGFASVLIQRRKICRLQLDTVFWATAAIGTLLALAVFALSFTTGWLFADNRVGTLLRLLSVSFIFNSLAAVPGVVISRLLLFRTEFWINTGALIARVAVAVGCAYAGMGVWSLVIGGIVGAFTTMSLSFACVPYTPRWRFHMPLLIDTWRTSGSYLGNNTLYYINSNLDLLLIGRQLGPTILGYYQNARSLTDEIRGRIAMPIQHVLFPAFSAVQGERQRLQELVLRAARLLAAVVVPIGVGVSANAPELVSVLYGERWQAMTPVMSILGIAAAIKAATAISSPLFNANNRVALGLRYNVIGTVVLICGVLVAMPYGIETVAVAVTLSALVSLVSCIAAFRLIGLGTMAVVQVLGIPTLASLALWLLTTILRGTLWSDRPAILLAGHIAAGSVVYLSVLLLLSRQYIDDLRTVGTLMARRS